jgi:sortase A
VTDVATQARPPRPPRPAAARAWSAVGVLGELLITLGVVLMLLVVYQLWWTNVEASRAADEAVAQLQEEWSRPPLVTPSPSSEPTDQPDEPDEPEKDEGPREYVPPEFGSAFALMYIPRLGDKVWGTPVLEGVGDAELARGLGHYPSAVLPGEVGNFAVAGHRATNGEPLRDIDRLTVGDEIYVETRNSWFVYSLERDRIVTPQSTWVIAPVPGDPGAKPREALITLTTCHPRWASYERWIWWGTLVETLDKESGEIPAAILEGR